MAENTKIEWCDATFNPWIGCAKVSPGCDNCYAAQQDKFRHWTPEGWGGPRKRTSIANWRGPVKWNADAAFSGARPRVFCASLADVFDNQVPAEWRADLFKLIASTPNLDWLLLTKRIGNAFQMMVDAGGFYEPSPGAYTPWPNIWLGATVINQEEADRDIPKLLTVPARVRFLSMEPLLGPVDLNLVQARIHVRRGVLWRVNFPNGEPWLDWVIVGGESGHKARPAHPDWYRSLRDQCAATGVPFLFKQWGNWLPTYDRDKDDPDWQRCGRIERACPTGRWLNLAGGHGFNGERVVWVDKVGKKEAGRLLDGRTWDGFPEAI